jgi:hypothetical protein
VLLGDVGADVLRGCADENCALLRELYVFGDDDGAYS